MLYLTIKVDIKEAGWIYAAAHSIFLDIANLYPAKTPEPVALGLKYGQELDGLRFAITSHIACFFEDGDTTKNPTIQYTLNIHTAEKLVSSFYAESDKTQVSRFRSLITFKMAE